MRLALAARICAGLQHPVSILWVELRFPEVRLAQPFLGGVPEDLGYTAIDLAEMQRVCVGFPKYAVYLHLQIPHRKLKAEGIDPPASGCDHLGITTFDQDLLSEVLSGFGKGFRSI